MHGVIDTSGPYAHAAVSVQGIMGQVMLALMPATLLSAWLFGWPAVALFLVTVGATVAAEAVCLLLRGRPLRAALGDGSAVLTGWLLALSLPPWAPWWIGVVGGVVAMTIGKHVFGGLGQNPFNPAMVARVFLLISFPVPMTRFTAPVPLTDPNAPGLLAGLGITFGGADASARIDAVSGATLLAEPHGVTALAAPAFGMIPGSLGETSALLLLAGGVYLIWKRVITWQIPVAMLATLLLLSGVSHLLDPDRFAGPMVHLLAGATMLGAFFIATDMVTAPVTPAGRLVFGAGCALLTWVIRCFAGYPEGLAFAILLMNAMTPLIDRSIRPRVYGRTRGGAPITPKPRA